MKAGNKRYVNVEGRSDKFENHLLSLGSCDLGLQAR